MLSQADIARKYGVDNGQLSRRAKKLCWTKNLREVVRSRALVLVRNLEEDRQTVKDQTVGPEVGLARSTEDLLSDAIQTQMSVILRHRKMILYGQDLVERLMHELEAQIPNQGAIEMPAEAAHGKPSGELNRSAFPELKTLSSLAATLVNLVSASQKLVTLERQAFGLEEKATKDPILEERNQINAVTSPTNLERAAAVLNLIERASRAAKDPTNGGTGTMQ